MLVLPQELTHAQASACARMLSQGVSAEQSQLVLVDASALGSQGARFDSSALAVLLECRREALAAGKTLSVRGLPERLRELAGLYGVAELLPVAA
jgi:phospholipid transport system transporter-binding protein